MRLSILIPNWNGIKFLHKCLISLRDQTCQEFEIIVVDNGSSDGSIDYLKNNFPEVKIIHFEENRGFAVAVNAGIKAALSQTVFLLNNDTEVDKECVCEILSALERYPDDSFFSCKMINFYHRDILDGAGDCLPRNFNPFRRGQFWKNAPEFEESLQIFGACAGAAVYKKNALVEIDYFDEDFFCYYEDVDVSIRLQLAGHKCRYLPKTIVYHIRSATSGSTLNPFIAKCLARNKILMFIKTITIPLFFNNFGILAFGEVMRVLYFLKDGFIKEYCAGLIEAVLLMPSALRKRRIIMKSVKVTNKYLQKIMIESEKWDIKV
jgi:GT2 family glycosyltransferase